MATISIENNNKNFIHPYKVILYLSMASMLMFFAITTSALLVKKGDIVSWQQFKLPSIFYASTLILIISSAFMHLSKNLYEKANFSLSKLLIVLSVFTAAIFVYIQYLGFDELLSLGMPLTGNASGSFVYVIVGAHAFHIIIGLLFSLIVFIKIFLTKNAKKDITEQNIVPKNLLYLELLNIFWHFIDFIWIYLFIFFYFNYQ